VIAAEDEAGRPGIGRPHHAAAAGGWLGGWIGLAAAPTFAGMAVLTAVSGGDADMMCGAGHGGSALGWPAIGGMVPMYVLMSAFHAGPWVRLMFGSGGLARCEE
jgi:hypothetical protein